MKLAEENLFYIGKSHIEGRGAFAVRDIEKGEVICVFTGVPKGFEEFEKMHEEGNTRISCDQLQVGVRRYLVLDEPYVCLNHSCEPNTGIVGEQTLVALRPISKDEEILYDYSATEWTVQDYPPYYTDGWPMICQCGAATCRQKIGCFPYLPLSIQKKYLESGVIQDHILERMKEPKETQRCFICERELGL